MSSISHFTYPRIAETGRTFLEDHSILRRLLYPLIQLVRSLHAFVTDYRLVHTYSSRDSAADTIRRIGHVARTRFIPPRTVLFYPEVPNHRYMIRALLTQMGVGLTNDPDRASEAAFLWKDATVVDPRPYQSAFAGFSDVVNGECTDISKSHVGACFRKAFGYDVSVDPHRYAGPMAVKSEHNGMHDGRVVTGPVSEREPATVYQRLIDNTLSPGLCVDYRVSIIDDTIPTVYLRFRRRHERFESDYTQWILVDVDDVLTQEEQRRLLAFSDEIGLDCGELDVLRDRSDDRIYVVDCNNTPWGPMTLMTRYARAEAAERMIAVMEPLIKRAQT